MDSATFWDRYTVDRQREMGMWWVLANLDKKPKDEGLAAFVTRGLKEMENRK